MSKKYGSTSFPFTVSTGKSFHFTEKFPLATKVAIVLLWLLGCQSIFVCVWAAVYNDVMGQDAHAYWLAGQGELVYNRAPGERDAYLYSPVFLMAIRPLTLLSWPLFHTVWVLLEAVVLFWLVRPLRIRWSVPIFLFCLPELLVGNIYLFLAAAAVIGVRTSAAWSLPILTKVTAGIGLLWFAFRGEWKKLLQGVGALALVVTISYVLDPAAWHAWIQFLFDHREGTPDTTSSFVLRCFAALLLVIVGARFNWPWLIAPAMVLTSPVLVGLIPYTLLAAIPRLAMALPPKPEITTGAAPKVKEAS